MAPTLDELLARGLQLEWFEAVAIVQAICTRALEGPSANPVRVPDLHQVVVHDDGTVERTGTGPECQSPVLRAGELLLTLAGGRPLPVSLRLLALTAVSPSPPYGGLPELVASLEYYERPGRSEVIRGVLDRYRRLPPEAIASAPGEETPARPPVEAPGPTSQPPWWKRGRVAVAAGLVLVVTAGTLGLWAGSRSRSFWFAAGAREATRVVRTTTDVVANTVSLGIDAIRVRFAGPPPLATTPSPESTRAPETVPSQPKHAVIPTTGGWIRAASGAAYAPPTVEAGKADSVAGLLPLLDPPVAAGAAPGEWTIYSADDADVVPPVAVHPKLPSRPPEGMALEDLPLLELLVSASGEIETARLLTPPPDVRTSMMVSAGKAWRFEPATINGRPVRYRLLVRLTRW